MFLNNAINNSNIKPFYCHHQQAATMAAVGQSKHTNNPGVVFCTAGCGSTNVITGLVDAWQDSNKLIVISGQANLEQTTQQTGLNLRKLGIQQLKTTQIVKHLTKYSTMVKMPDYIAYILQKAWYLCNTGRPGPVWIDVPLDIQNKSIQVQELIHYTQNDQIYYTKNIFKNFSQYLKNSKRPVILAGYGIFLSDTQYQFKEFIKQYNIPVVSTIANINLLKQDDPLYVGRSGIKGTRAGNFALANSDLIIAMGSSLSISDVGFNYKIFARQAKVIAIDIDQQEHFKKVVRVQRVLNVDLKQFFKLNTHNKELIKSQDWIKKCQYWKNKWNIYDRHDINQLNHYSFARQLSKHNVIVTTDAGSSYYVMAQALQNTQLIFPATQGQMGFALPSSIGVQITSPTKKVACVTGDGSFQFNIQELQTIKHYNLPIKVFVMNNNGYLSMRNTNKKFFNNEDNSYISFPSLQKIAKAYQIRYQKIEDYDSLCKIKDIINSNQPIICQVICPQNQQIYPSASSKILQNGKFQAQPLQNMYPFLSDQQIRKEMIVRMHNEEIN